MQNNLCDLEILKKKHEHLLEKIPQEFWYSLVFDNALLVPGKSLPSRDPQRGGADISGKFSRHIDLKVPLISSNMNSVTEARMAIAMARLGGIGVLHRFCSIEDEAKMVADVKRAEGFKIDDPYKVHFKATLGEAQELMSDKNTSGLLVVDNRDKLVGIFTRRDMPIRGEKSILIKNLMTPRNKLVVAPEDVNIEKIIKIFDKTKKEKLPLVDKKDRVVGLVTKKDIEKLLFYKNSTKDKNSRLQVAAAIGVTEDEKERAKELVKIGADALVVDIANGHSDSLIKMLAFLKKKFPEVDVVAGNVATYQAAKDLIEAGADAIKVGIGSGAACKTREQTGFGVSQISAILQASALDSGVPLIADGGVRKPADFVKALAAGASSVMMGGIFASTDESPGIIVDKGSRGKFKIYQGMASYKAVLDRIVRSGEGIKMEKIRALEDVSENVDEGVSGEVRYSGSVAQIFKEYAGGARSAFSYGSSQNLKEFQKSVQFVYQTESGARESAPHDMIY